MSFIKGSDDLVYFPWGGYARLSEMSDKQYQKYLKSQATKNNRTRELEALKSGNTTNNLFQNQLGNIQGFGGLFTGGQTGASGDNPYGLSGFGGGINLGFGDKSYLDTAKELAEFRLGLDKQQAQFSRGLREDESQADFGRATKLQAQQIEGSRSLEDLRQTATTGRLEKELANRQQLQREGFDFALLKQGKERAAALRGLG